MEGEGEVGVARFRVLGARPTYASTRGRGNKESKVSSKRWTDEGECISLFIITF